MSSRKVAVQVMVVAAALFLVSSSNVFAEPCQADIDCDSKVQLSDLVIMKSEFLNTGCDSCMCNPIYACPAGMVNCGGECIDPMKDREYCGADFNCMGGSACLSGQICSSGVCVLSCQQGLTNCSGQCVNTDTDEDYCGSCTNSCGSGEICLAGSCAIAGPVVYEAAVEKTGQTTSYATGDDGDLERGVAWPNPRFTDNLDGTVTDNLTGLIWLKDANCFGTRTWNNALSDCNGLSSGQCGLTDGSGANEWRLPNRRELFSLIDDENYSPALPSGHPFTNVQSVSYWSSTTYAGSTAYAWGVSMLVGYVNSGTKAYDFYVWPVRGGQ